jgi:hypothetical protein
MQSNNEVKKIIKELYQTRKAIENLYSSNLPQKRIAEGVNTLKEDLAKIEKRLKSMPVNCQKRLAEQMENETYKMN